MQIYRPEITLLCTFSKEEREKTRNQANLEGKVIIKHQQFEEQNTNHQYQRRKMLQSGTKEKKKDDTVPFFGKRDTKLPMLPSVVALSSVEKEFASPEYIFCLITVYIRSRK
jgi:hypothetical protein